MAKETTATTNQFNAYSVEKYDADNGKKARRWTRIGIAFPHKEGPGLNVELLTLPIDGRIVLVSTDREGSDNSDCK